jgi:hypothetical protein
MKEKKVRNPTKAETAFLTIANYVQPIAFKNVLDGGVDYQIRHIQRWFSKEFSTKLEDVENMDPYEVLLHFFESHYEQQDEADREETYAKILETEEERSIRLSAEEEKTMADEELLRIVKAETERKKLEDHSSAKPAMGKLTETIENLTESLSQLNMDDDKEGFAFERISEAEMEKQIAELDMAILGPTHES